MDAATPTALESALAAHAPRLLPGAAEQLARILGPDLTDVSDGVVRDVVDLRLARPEYARFFAPADSRGRPTVESQIAARAPLHMGNALAGHRGNRGA